MREHGETSAKPVLFGFPPSLNSYRLIDDKWMRLARNAILVLGAPRSGTTWLAKIVDSHPDILYRHEPDELCPPNPALDPAAQIAAWLCHRGLRSVAKRPLFAKSWRPAPLTIARNAMAAALSGAQRMPVCRTLAAQMPLPDLVLPPRSRSVRAALKLVNWDGTAAARTMAPVRCIFILRHPCAQVASVLAGQATRRLAAGAESLALAKAWAARGGVDAAAFAALPEAGRLAWTWLAFNEPALDGLRGSANARVILYEDLCKAPAPVSRELFGFAGLDWHPQTAAFLDQSTREDRGGGYFDVFRAGASVAERWRTTMSAADQEAVRSVVAGSALAGCWPDLV